MEKEIKQRWDSKRHSVYNLKEKIDSLKRKVRADLYSSDEKTKLTAIVIRIMLHTSERVGNENSAINGRFGITQLKNKHIKVTKTEVVLNYIGKSGVEHWKNFCDEPVALILMQLKNRKNEYIFTTKDGFKIKADKVNRYLRHFDVKSKDIRGFNANRYMVMELNRIGKVNDEKERAKIFNMALRKISKKIGHGASTLRTHYLLPEIEKCFYENGNLKKLKINL